MFTNQGEQIVPSAVNEMTTLQVELTDPNIRLGLYYLSDPVGCLYVQDSHARLWLQKAAGSNPSPGRLPVRTNREPKGCLTHAQ